MYWSPQKRNPAQSGCREQASSASSTRQLPKAYESPWLTKARLEATLGSELHGTLTL